MSDDKLGREEWQSLRAKSVFASDQVNALLRMNVLRGFLADPNQTVDLLNELKDEHPFRGLEGFESHALIWDTGIMCVRDWLIEMIEEYCTDDDVLKLRSDAPKPGDV